MSEPGDILERLNVDPAFSEVYDWLVSQEGVTGRHGYPLAEAGHLSKDRIKHYFPDFPAKYLTEEGYKLLKEATRGFVTLRSLVSFDYTPEDINEEREMALEEAEWAEEEFG